MRLEQKFDKSDSSRHNWESVEGWRKVCFDFKHINSSEFTQSNEVMWKWTKQWKAISMKRVIGTEWKRDCLKLIPMNKTHHCHNIIIEWIFIHFNVDIFTRPIGRFSIRNLTVLFSCLDKRSTLLLTMRTYDSICRLFSHGMNLIRWKWAIFKLTSKIGSRLEMSSLEINAKKIESQGIFHSNFIQSRMLDSFLFVRL